MFTGIITAVGEIKQLTPRDGDLLLTINTCDWDLTDVALGDSIAVSGVCLTVIKKLDKGFQADVSAETLTKTILGQARVGSAVNLEKALRLTDRLGGHLVSGHVDGIGEVVERVQDARSWRFVIRPPESLLRYIAAKGSITINGISLTVNHVTDSGFDVNIVPHTLQCTTMKSLDVGEQVNLEIDVLARYLEQLNKYPDKKTEEVSKDLLHKSGFIE